MLKSNNTNTKNLYLFKVIFLIGVNIFCVIVIALVLTSLPKGALELQNARLDKINNESQSNMDLIKNEVTNFEEELAQLKSYFPDDLGIVTLANKIDSLKLQGVITEFSFASDTIVKDKTGYGGIPIKIEMKGTKDQLNGAFSELDKIGVSMRPIIFDIQKTDEISAYSMSLGYFLYVYEDITKIR